MSDPSAFEQLMLEYINRARMDPQGEFDRFIVSTSPVQAIEPGITSALNYFDVDLALYQQQLAGLQAAAPLAWSSTLNDAATAHSELMIAQDTQSHQLSGEASLGTRIAAAGYTGWNRLAENIYAYTESPAYGHAGFFIDWGNGPGGMQSPAGHRNNIMNANLTEVGIGVVEDNSGSTDVGPYVVTQDFGHRFAYEPQFVGVVYNDNDVDAFYSVGEGQGGVVVDVSPWAGGSGSTTTHSAGGYQVEGGAGWNTLTFSGSGLGGGVSVHVRFDDENVKVDLIDGSRVESSARTMLGDGARDLTLLGQSSIRGDGNWMDNALTGNSGGNWMFGKQGADTMVGGEGNDSLFGNQQEDSLSGGPGADWLHGGQHDDFVEGNEDPDTLWGGAGSDTLAGGDGQDSMYGNYDDDSMIGGGGDDSMHGGRDNDWLDGGAGADTMEGGSGSDTLLGGDGNDILIGNAGADLLNGGNGNDVFELGSAADAMTGAAGRDTITGGFDNPGAALGDRIDVSDLGAFFFLGENEFLGAGRSELRIGAGSNQALVQGDLDGDGLADFEVSIENLFASSLTGDDFIGLA